MNYEYKMAPRWRYVGLIGLMLVLSVTLLLPTIAEADDAYLTPSIAVLRVYDDNLFFEANNPQADSFWRISPALAAGYDTGTLSLNAYYSLDAEYYEQYPELDRNSVRRNGRLGIDYDATERLSLSLQSQYTSTYTPGQLAANVGLQLGRVYAESLSVNPSLSYRFTEQTTATAGYTYNSFELADGPASQLKIATLGADHRISKTDSLGANLIYSTYQFGNNGEFTNSDPLSSKALTLSWSHTLSPNASFLIAAGPRYFEDTVSPEVSASARYALENGDISVSYVRSQTALIGRTEPVNTQYLIINFDYRPTERLNFRISPSFAQNWNENTDTEIYTMNFDISYRINSFMSAVGSYQFNLQSNSDQSVSSAAATPLEIKQNVISVGLRFSLDEESQDGGFMENNIPMPTPASRRSIQ